MKFITSLAKTATCIYIGLIACVIIFAFACFLTDNHIVQVSEKITAKQPVPEISRPTSIFPDNKEPLISKDDLAHIEALAETGRDVLHDTDPVLTYKNYAIILKIHTHWKHDGHDEIVAEVCQVNGINNTAPIFLTSYNEKWKQNDSTPTHEQEDCDYYSRTGQHKYRS